MASIEKRILKNGKASYRAVVRLRGFPTECATFEKQGDARHWAQTVEADMRAARYGSGTVARKYTAPQMIQRYMDSVLESKTTNTRYVEQQRKQLTWWAARLKDYRLSNLTPYLFNDCKEELAGKNYATRKPATVNRYLSALSHVINTAIKEWGWMDTNPIVKISKPKEPRGRARFLTDGEREALLAACAQETKKPLHLIVVFAISTGARKSEILNLKRRDVDLERRVAVAYDTKNGDPRQLYLCDHLVELLTAWMERHRTKAKYVFSARTGAPINIEMEWRRALRRARIEDFRFHDLRHTFASYMAMNGGDLGTIGEALGHRDHKQTKRYTHHTKTHVAGAVTAMNQKVFGQQQTGANV
jgi:integrase